jgi:hypothetical protein
MTSIRPAPKDQRGISLSWLLDDNGDGGLSCDIEALEYVVPAP